MAHKLAVLGAIQGRIPGVGVSLGYRIAILLVSVPMLLLPILYLAIIVAAACALFYHAVTGFDHFQNLHFLIRIALYVGPIVAAGSVVYTMLRSIFLTFHDTSVEAKLDPSEEGLLFAYVGKLCTAMGAPAPDEIRVCLRASAAASPRVLAFGVFDHGLVLTLGLPLFATFTLREISWVIAHELGHFTQGGGMRASRMIRGINLLFRKAQLSSKVLAARHVAALGNPGILNLIIGFCIQLAHLATRIILILFVRFSDLISFGLLRQMEYHADRQATKVAGSACCKSSLFKLRILDRAQKGSMISLRQMRRQEGLPPNLIDLLAAEFERVSPLMHNGDLPPEFLRRTGLFDSHPSDKARIRRCSKEGGEGIVSDAFSARDLLPNLDALGARLTREVYAQAGLIKPFSARTASARL